MSNKLHKIAKYGIPILAALLYIFIAFCVPYCHDDWDWGLDVGLKQWLHAELNSRYVGSFFVIIMTRSEIVKTAIMAICLFSVPMMVSFLAVGRYDVKTYLLANLLLLAVPQKLWQQTIGWVSAFANYVISAAAVLALLLLLLRYIKKEDKSKAKLIPRLFTIALFSCGCGLFYESLSVFLFIVGIIGLGFCIHPRLRKALPYAVAYALGAGIGLMLILSNTLYSELLENGQALGGIRQLAFSSDMGFFQLIKTVLSRYFKILLPGLMTVHPLLTVFLTLSAILGSLRAKRRLSVFFASSALSVVCTVLLLLPFGEALLPYAAVGELVAWGVLVFDKKAIRNLLFLLSAALVIAPLSVTPELGPRLYYFPCVLLLTVTLSVLPNRNSKILTVVIMLLFALSMAFYIYIYSEIRSVTVAREKAVNEAVSSNAEYVVMVRDKYKYWWGRNPTGESRIPYFKEFYGIPADMEVIFEQ